MHHARPVAVTRAIAIANQGVLQPSRYVVRKAGKEVPLRPGKRLAQRAEYADQLEQFMIAQSSPAGGRSKISGVRVAGKTGTPQRIVQGEQENDGWYVFFAPTPNGRSHTVVVVRIELGRSSSEAIRLANTTVAPILKAQGYLGSF